ncbi:MAG: hypothetical protein ACTSWY_15290 [Promethearchaeota archaeon]
MSINFNRELKALEKSLAIKTKQKAKNIQKNGNLKIKELKEEFVKKIKNELLDSTKEFLKDDEYRLNQHISDNIKKLSKEILDIKNELYKDLKLTLLAIIQQKIRKNYKKYKDFIFESLRKRVGIYDSEILIKLNTNDQKIFNDIISEFKGNKIILDKEILDNIGGYILESPTITIDDTIENLIRKKEVILKQSFSSIFPDYIDIRKSATELMKERNIKDLYFIPERLHHYIEENDIKA